VLGLLIITERASTKMMDTFNPRSIWRWLTCASPALLLLSTLLSHVNVASADNPFVQTIYAPDPAPIVYNGRMYVFTGHDEDGSTTFNMNDWRLFSSSDMANWQDHGVVMSLKTFSWAKSRAWAGQVGISSARQVKKNECRVD
jgi:hypothetical protein